MLESLKIAVASDLHCMYKSADTPSGITFLYSNASPRPVALHPVYALLEMLKSENIKSDILICPGDIADKADSQGLISGWEFLKKIKDTLNAKDLISTIGNHDVDSRKVNGSSNAFDQVKNLDLNFPLPQNNDLYWSRGFVLMENEQYQAFVFNSCHNHFTKEDAKLSYISLEMLEDIDKMLAKCDKKKYRFAICHHHPIKHSNIDKLYRDGDVIENGDKLIQLLDRYDFQILVHGHKHDPRLKRENSLTIFAAGSFSSLMNVKELGADNCFHLIELQPFKKHGTITTWIYAPTRGWEIKSDREFPCFTGFGSGTPVDIIAEECNKLYDTKSVTNITFKELQTTVPDILFLIPDDQIKLSKVLSEKFGLTLVPELPNSPKILTKLFDE